MSTLLHLSLLLNAVASGETLQCMYPNGFRDMQRWQERTIEELLDCELRLKPEN